MIQGKSGLCVGVANNEELSLMQENKSEHTRLYKSICVVSRALNNMLTSYAFWQLLLACV